MEPIKIVFKMGDGIGRSSRSGEFDKNILYAFMENHSETPLYN
jgi:hypothetical protein